GNYLVENFYGNDIELARKKKSPKKETLKQLIKLFKVGSFASPSKSWIYQSICIVVQSFDVKKMGEEIFQTYGKILLSHKICLLPVKDLDSKKEFIHAIVQENLSVRQLEARKIGLRNTPSKKPGLLTLLNFPDKIFNDENRDLLNEDALKRATPDNLGIIKDKAIKKRESLQQDILDFKEKIKTYETFIMQYDELSQIINKMLRN
ncbi:MAG: hypothetical protein K8S18_19930, partial [Desulfobacula sp.]|nr:hypothetical protein [Desulfobacula sp.]